MRSNRTLRGRLRDPHDREILRLGLPAFGALVAQPLYVLADTAVVGHLGTAQLGGLAVASAALLTGQAVFVFLAYGTTASVARRLGAGDERGAAHEAVQALWLAGLLGVALAVVVWPLAGPLVDALGGGGTVRSHALVYLRISLFGLPATFATLAGTGYLRGLQDTRTTLVVAVASAAGNLGLELALIPGLGFGIGASALSTVAAEVGAAAVYALWIGRAVRGHGVSLRPHAATLRRLGVAGRDLFLRTAALRGSLTLATAVAARIGTADLAAHEVAFAVWSFLALALDAVAIAGQAMIGRLLGAGRADDARAAGRRMLEWGLVIGVAFGALVALSQPLLPHVFTGDPQVARLTGFLLLWVAALQPVNGVVFALDGILIGAGDMRFLAWAMAGAGAAFAAPALAVLALDAGIGWLWASLGVLMVARLIALLARFAGPAWAVTGAQRVATR